MPAATFTHPEIATVGIQEHEAKAKNLAVNVRRLVPLHGAGPADVHRPATEGFVKSSPTPRPTRLLGVSAVGYQASDLIAEAASPSRWARHPEDIALTVHAHPTWPESIMEAAEASTSTRSTS